MKTFMIAIIGLLLLTQCNISQDDNFEVADSPLPPKPKPVNPLVGKWGYQHTIWYHADLTLFDSTFQFHNQSCLGQSFTEGKWVSENGIIFLSSWDSYNPLEKKKNFVGHAEKQVRKKRKPKKDEFTYSYTDFATTSRDFKMPSPNDTTRMLHRIGEGQLISGHIFTRKTN